MAASWYAHEKFYDFASGKAVAPKKLEDLKGLTSMLWSGPISKDDKLNLVAFGVQSGCARARFCGS